MIVLKKTMQAEIKRLAGLLDATESHLEQQKAGYDSLMDMFLKESILCYKTVNALKEIAAQETPSANATVKRMAKIAREALEL